MVSDTVNSISVETSGAVGSVAVARGPDLLASRAFDTRNQHGVELLPVADELCRTARITAASVHHVYVSAGPGSFTGLRIGITFAKAMAFAAGASVVRVPTLFAAAQNACHAAPPPARIVPMLDAKRRNVYCALFERRGQAYARIEPDAEREPAAYLSTLGKVAVLGDGVACHHAAVAAAPDVTVLPEPLNRVRVEAVFELGRQMAARGVFTPVDELVPVYIRRPEAEERWEKRHGAEQP